MFLQVVQEKLAQLLRAHFDSDIAEPAAREPTLFGAVKEGHVRCHFLVASFHV